jgi:hypothetical protein
MMNEQNAEVLAAIAKAKQRINEIENQEIDRIQIKPKAPEGSFIAVTTDAKLERNQKSHFGMNDRIKVTFTVLVPNHDPESVELTSTYWKSSSPTSVYCLQLTELLGKDVRQGFSLRDLIGITCQVSIEHRQTDSGTYASIAEVKPVNIEVGSVNF